MASDDSAGRLTSEELSGLNVYATDGTKMGSVAQVYIDDVSDKPAWVTVKTGLFGTKESFIPLAGARRDGSDLHIPYDSSVVKDAPRMDADQHLDPSQEGELYQHYGLTPGAGQQSETARGGDMATEERETAMPGTTEHMGTSGDTAMSDTAMAGDAPRSDDAMARDPGMETTDADLRGPASEHSTRAGGGTSDTQGMTLSEEQLRIGTEEHESGRARLRKYVVTEHVTRTVPVSHEEVRLVREPISESERRRGHGRIHEEEMEVTLHEERPTIRKEAVPVERVRLETEKVTEQEEISADVRKEQVEYDAGKGRDVPGKGGDMPGKGRGRHA